MIGIDQQVQQRMDQFRGRPQDLMQKYQVSRELIDLLALQKLKSEKDSIARNMIMQMQQNPQTIAAQREAELMGRTQQEVAQQVGGIAQLADARRKQNLARIASGQASQRMAEGGIARFQEGGETQLEARMRQAKDLLGDVGEGIMDVLDYSPIRIGYRAGQRAYDAATLPREEYAEKYGPVSVDEDAPFEQQPIPGMPPDSLQEIDTITLPQRRPPRPGPTPADLRAEEEARVREALREEGIMSAYQDMIRRQRELSSRLQDPEQQRRDRLSAFLRGMAGRSTFGLTGAGGSAGLAAERRRQNALAQQLLDKEFGLTREQLGAQAGIGKEALAGGRSVFEQSSADLRSAADRAAEAAIAQGKLRLDALGSERDARIEIRKVLADDPTYQALMQEYRALQADEEDTTTAEDKIRQYERQFEDRLLRGPVVGIRRRDD